MVQEVNNGYRHILPIQIRFNEIKAGDHIAARTRTTKIGNKSFHLEQDIIDVDTQEVKCRCASVMVLYDLEHHQTMPFPDAWRQAIRQYDGLE